MPREIDAVGIAAEARRVAGGPGDGVAALLPPPGDPVALGAAIMEVLDEPDLARRLRAVGSARADRFSMSRLCDEYLRLYSGVMASVS